MGFSTVAEEPSYHRKPMTTDFYRALSLLCLFFQEDDCNQNKLHSMRVSCSPTRLLQMPRRITSRRHWTFLDHMVKTLQPEAPSPLPTCVDLVLFLADFSCRSSSGCEFLLSEITWSWTCKRSYMTMMDCYPKDAYTVIYNLPEYLPKTKRKGKEKHFSTRRW